MSIFDITSHTYIYLALFSNIFCVYIFHNILRVNGNAIELYPDLSVWRVKLV